jgi:biopolymer transport protein TolR
MGMSVGGGSGVKAEPNVVPMIDVMLVLLIIFMIVIPSIAAGATAIPPQGVNLKPHPEQDQDQMLVIDVSGQYYLNKNPIRNETLGEHVKTIYDARTIDKIMYVKAHKELEYSKVLDALDILGQNGVRVSALVTEQEPGTESTVPGDAGSTPGGG